MDKCNILNIIKDKPVEVDIHLPNCVIIESIEDRETYKYLRYQQARLLEGRHANGEVEDYYLKLARGLLKTELYYLYITAINTCAVPVLVYSFGIIKNDSHDD